MNAKDQRKLCKAGYTILRKCDMAAPSIKHKSTLNPDSWKKYGEYKSKAERDRRMAELLEDNKHIED